MLSDRVSVSTYITRGCKTLNDQGDPPARRPHGDGQNQKVVVVGVIGKCLIGRMFLHVTNMNTVDLPVPQCRIDKFTTFVKLSKNLFNSCYVYAMPM